MAELEAFIMENNLDSKAGEALRSADSSIQEAVLSRGSLSDYKNPSSALVARIREEKSKSMVIPTDIEEFISLNNLDERAAEAIRSCEPAVREYVMRRGDLQDCSNPSAVILSRMKQAHVKGIGSGEMSSMGRATAEEVEQYIQDNELDDRAAAVLNDCTPEIQRIVLNRGDVRNANNPSAAVLSRIRDAQSRRNNRWGGGGGRDGGGWDDSGGMDMMPMMQMMMMPMMMMMKGMKGMGKGCGKGCGKGGKGGGQDGYGGWGGGDAWSDGGRSAPYY